MDKALEKIFKCEKCQELRELPLHLHELAMFSELLFNTHGVFIRKKGNVKQSGEAHTETIAKWLRLASQLERVDLNTFRYEEAHLYCEPVGDMLDSNAKHHETIITPLTRLVFVSNALEECYRFISPLYQEAYDLLLTHSPRVKYLRDNSAQAAFLLEKKGTGIAWPKHYGHLVENFLKIVILYKDQFGAHFDVDLNGSEEISYGLSLVRNIRNQIAHGIFPIIEDPEYTFELNNPHTKRNLVNLLGQASRLAAINIQMLLAISSRSFESDSYEALRMDDDYGEYFANNCNFDYLLSLHISQKFGLNEADYFSLSTNIQEKSPCSKSGFRVR